MAALEQQDKSFFGALIRQSPGVNGRRVAFVLCCLLGIGMVLPLVWLIRSSLMEMGQIFIFPPEWIPICKHCKGTGDMSG